MKIRNILWLLTLVGLFFTGCTTGPTTEELQAALEAEKNKTVTLTSAIEAESVKQESLQDTLSYHQRNNDIYRKHIQDAMDSRDTYEKLNQYSTYKYNMLRQDLEETEQKRRQLPTMLPYINLNNAYPSMTVPDGITKETLAKEKAILGAIRTTLDAMEKLKALHIAEEENYFALYSTLNQQMGTLTNARQDETLEYYALEIKRLAAWDVLVQIGRYRLQYESQIESLRDYITKMEEAIAGYENTLSK